MDVVVTDLRLLRLRAGRLRKWYSDTTAQYALVRPHVSKRNRRRLDGKVADMRRQLEELDVVIAAAEAAESTDD